METSEEKRVVIRSLTRNTLGVEGHVVAPGWGLGRMANVSIIHMNMQKPNNKLIGAWLKHFWTRTNHGHTQTHKIHRNLDLGEAITFPIIIFFVHGHRACTQMSFCPGSLEIP
jgi:hypothetical protein